MPVNVPNPLKVRRTLRLKGQPKKPVRNVKVYFPQPFGTPHKNAPPYPKQKQRVVIYRRVKRVDAWAIRVVRRQQRNPLGPNQLNAPHKQRQQPKFPPPLVKQLRLHRNKQRLVVVPRYPEKSDEPQKICV